MSTAAILSGGVESINRAMLKTVEVISLRLGLPCRVHDSGGEDSVYPAVFRTVEVVPSLRRLMEVYTLMAECAYASLYAAVAV